MPSDQSTPADKSRSAQRSSDASRQASSGSRSIPPQNQAGQAGNQSASRSRERDRNRGSAGEEVADDSDYRAAGPGEDRSVESGAQRSDPENPERPHGERGHQSER